MPRRREGSEDRAQRARGQGAASCLGQELRHQAPASRSQRAAQGQLALPMGRAREEEVRDVGAGDEQDEPDRAEQDEQGGRTPATSCSAGA